MKVLHYDLRPTFLQRPNFLPELAEESWLDLAAVIRMRTFLPCQRPKEVVLFGAPLPPAPQKIWENSEI